MVLFLALLDTQEEQEKFREIYENYRHFMWYIAQQKLKDTHLAEDAVQEAFLALTRHLDKVEDAHSPGTKKFLATIVRSKAIDLRRMNNPQEVLTDGLPEGKAGRDILDQLLVKENYNRLISCVLELDDSYRVVFEYKYLYQMSDAEIADILGIIEGAAEGVGLGLEFLRHIERTKVIIHIVDAASIDGRDPVNDVKIINEELKNLFSQLYITYVH